MTQITGTCYQCGSRLDLVACIPDVEARHAMAALADAVGGAAGRRILSYIAAFGDGTTPLPWPRVQQIASELAPLIHSPTVTLDGKHIPTTPAIWQQGITTLLAKPDLRRPLGSHALLVRIVGGIAEKHAQEQEDKQIDRARAGAHRTGTPTHPGPRSVIDLAASHLRGEIATLESLIAVDPGNSTLIDQLARLRSRLPQTTHAEETPHA